jgi:hypothetical protein
LSAFSEILRPSYTPAASGVLVELARPRAECAKRPLDALVSARNEARFQISLHVGTMPLR